jgi:hypothetical protein
MAVVGMVRERVAATPNHHFDISYPAFHYKGSSHGWLLAKMRSGIFSIITSHLLISMNILYLKLVEFTHAKVASEDSRL